MHNLYPGIILLISTSLFLLYAFWRLYPSAQFHKFVGSVLWGMLAFAGAFLAHRLLVGAHLISVRQAQLFTAPVLEEVLKALPVIYLAIRWRSDRSINGRLYGFGMGLGFAALESLAYMTHDPANALGTAAARLVSINLLHGMSTALIGIASGYANGSPYRVSYVMVAVGTVALMHALVNGLTAWLGMVWFPGAVVLAAAGMLLLILLPETAPVRLAVRVMGEPAQ